MKIRDLIPWRNNRDSGLAARNEEANPFLQLRDEVDRMFEDFSRAFERSGGWLSPHGFEGNWLNGGWPKMDVSETDKEVEVSAELPGIDQKDVEVLLTGDALTIRGEKKHEAEEKKKDYYKVERSYGSFSRSVPLPAGIDAEKVKADFKNGVLTVTIPKTEESIGNVKRIELNKH